MTPHMNALEPAGPQADHIGSLWNVFLAVSVVVWLAVVVALAIAATVAHRRRRRSGAGDPLDYDPAQEKRLARGVAVAGALTVVTLFALLASSIVTGRALASLEEAPGALHVRITAHQWWWEIQYEPELPSMTASTANELHLPVGVPVHLELRSADVIHSFWIPSLHGKKDLIPGRTNRTWLRIDAAGSYRGQCAEFCGLEHAKMALTVVAEPAPVFDAWLQHQREESTGAMTALTLRGQELFVGGTCAQCHTIAGTMAGGRVGPDLTHVASRATIGAGALPNTPLEMARWIRNPHVVKPGVLMPALSLSDEDMHALVTYLETLR